MRAEGGCRRDEHNAETQEHRRDRDVTNQQRDQKVRSCHRSGAELRALGRLGQPMLRRRGDPGFRPVGWDEALDLVAAEIRRTTPDRLALYLTWPLVAQSSPHFGGRSFTWITSGGLR